MAMSNLSAFPPSESLKPQLLLLSLKSADLLDALQAVLQTVRCSLRCGLVLRFSLHEAIAAVRAGAARIPSSLAAMAQQKKDSDGHYFRPVVT